MPKHTYDDVVRVRRPSYAPTRWGQRAWIIGVFEDRPPGRHFDQFSAGVVYSVEFEDGEAIDIHEDDLEPCLAPDS